MRIINNNFIIGARSPETEPIWENSRTFDCDFFFFKVWMNID